jgi:putative copper resistance protein D
MIDGLWLALRAAAFILVLQAAGYALFLALFAHTLAPHVLTAIRPAATRLALAALAVVLAQGLFEPAHLAGAWDGLTDPALRRLVWGSSGTAVLALRLGGLTLLALALRRSRTAVAPLAALLTLGSFLVSGHVLLATHRVLLLALLALHVLVVAFWIGALLPLRTVARLEPAAAVAQALRHFSAYALWLVPLLALAGLMLACALLPDLAALRRPYGMLLCLKALLFAVLIALAALNRQRLTPALARGETGALVTLRRSLSAEYVLMAAALLATAALTGFYSPED